MVKLAAITHQTEDQDKDPRPAKNGKSGEGELSQALLAGKVGFSILISL